MLPLSFSPAERGRYQRGSRLPIDDRAPGMPLLGFVIGIVLSTGLWALIGLTAWAIIN